MPQRVSNHSVTHLAGFHKKIVIAIVNVIVKRSPKRYLLCTIFKAVEGFLFFSSIINAFVFVLVCLHVFVFVILVVMSSLPFTLNNLPKKSHVSGNILCCMLSTNLLYLSLNYLKFILTVIFKIPRLLKSDHHRVGSH